MAAKPKSTITVAKELSQQITDVAREMRTSKNDLTSQVMRWFVAQDKKVRALVIGDLPDEYVGPAVEWMLRWLAENAERSMAIAAPNKRAEDEGIAYQPKQGLTSPDPEKQASEVKIFDKTTSSAASAGQAKASGK